MKACIKYLKYLFLPVFALLPVTAWAADSMVEPAHALVKRITDEEPVPDMLAQIQLHTPEELEKILLRAEKYVDAYNKFPQSKPIVFVLHGAEAEVFRKQNYQQHKHIVDLAAQLEAYNVVDIKVCEMWMRVNKMEPGDVPAFVDTVNYGPWQEFKLKREGYVYF